MKNTKKAFNREQMKNDAKDKKEVCPAIRMTRDFLDQNVALAWNFMLVMIVMQAEDNERREKNLEEAKKITIENDPSLPKPDTVCLCFLFCFLNHAFLQKGHGRRKKSFCCTREMILLFVCFLSFYVPLGD